MGPISDTKVNEICPSTKGAYGLVKEADVLIIIARQILHFYNRGTCRDHLKTKLLFGVLVLGCMYSNFMLQVKIFI